MTLASAIFGAVLRGSHSFIAMGKSVNLKS